MIQSLKNIESFKLIWLTNKNEINDAIKCFDDNEPNKTAGTPMLEILRKKKYLFQSTSNIYHKTKK